jgi:RNA polymerase sigma factor (sigma-70 family)
MDKYTEAIHVITDFDKYIDTHETEKKERHNVPRDPNADDSHCKYKGCWCHAKIELPKAEHEAVDSVENLLAKKWDYIVVGAARGWNNPTMMDELLSAGRLGLLEGIRTWNQSKSKQVTYYSVCVKRAMINAMRKQDTFEKYHTRLEDQAMEQEEDTLEELTWEDVIEVNDLNPEELIIRREEIEEAKAILALVVGELNDREKFVLKYRILDNILSLAVIAAKWGTSYESIRRDEKRIRTRLEQVKLEHIQTTDN